MRLVDRKNYNIFEKLYCAILNLLVESRTTIIPYIRRFVRLIALPYLYFNEVDWKVCQASKLTVAYDMLYIFFRLKYYPDNYYPCRLWELDKQDWPYYYGSIYDPYQRKKMIEHVYCPDNIVLFENKHVCYHLCKSAGFPLPKQYATIFPTDNFKEVLTKLLVENENVKLIVKLLDGKGGNGIVVCYKDKCSGNILIKKNNIVCGLDEFELNFPAVIQEYVNQHNLLSDFSRSTNTVRVVTYFTNDKNVLIVGAFVRFGVEGSDIDNLSSGGMACGVNVVTGEIYDTAYNFNGYSYMSHPNSQKNFKNFSIPYWDQIIDLSKGVQSFFSFHRLLGLDICITDSGPIIIEINAEPDIVALEMTYGPILKRHEVWKEFKNDDLLINIPSVRLTEFVV